jgi:hypothetical protein
VDELIPPLRDLLPSFTALSLESATLTLSRNPPDPPRMSSVAEIEAAIEQLSPDQVNQIDLGMVQRICRVRSPRTLCGLGREVEDVRDVLPNGAGSSLSLWTPHPRPFAALTLRLL